MVTPQQIEAILSKVRESVSGNARREVYVSLFSMLDLTTLSPRDTEHSVSEFADQVMAFYGDHPELPNVASICVFPPFVESVGLVIDGSQMRITSVAGGFPASQTFLEVKALEVAMAVESGADEIDVVIPIGKILTGDYDDARSEIELLRIEAADTTLKVIIESGELCDAQHIYDASMVAIDGGADFIKTSTGKSEISATPEAVVVMCQAIKDHYERSGERVGIKVAGGVRTTDDALLYYTIVEHMLGAEWLSADLFRIGASSLANNLLSSIVGEETVYF